MQATSLSGSEELGRPFRFELIMGGSVKPVSLEDIVGEDITLELGSHEGTRYFNGYISSFSQEGSDGTFHTFRAVLSPWTWFLTLTKNCRVFQKKDAFEIFDEICGGEVYCKIEKKLSRTLVKREYCVQYQETDFDFISRLFEEEGIYYYYEHAEDGHTMVLCDNSSDHADFMSGTSLEYTDGASRKIDSLLIREGRNPKVFTHRDYDFTKSKTAIKATGNNDAPDGLVYEYPARVAEVADAESLATIRTEELAALRRVVEGTTTVVDAVQAGFKFTIDGLDESLDLLAVGVDYAIEGTELEGGGTADSFVTTFRAIPADTQFRPARSTPRPQIAGPQSATVVGPDGEEVYADEYGRIQVVFHWYSTDQADEEQSCWVRVVQPWAGKSFGALLTPRIGQEVLVGFLDGDLDRPVVVGSLYNDVQAVPYKPSEMPKRMSLKTFSAESETGFNEIRLDDKKDNEDLFVHAAKDRHTTITNDSFETVKHDRDRTVENDERVTVKNNRDVTVEKDHKELVKGARDLTVEKDETKNVDGKLTLTVKGPMSETFQDEHSEDVTKKYSLSAMEISLTADTKIEIKAGANSIKLEAAGITLSAGGGELSLQAAMAELKGPKTTVKGDAMLELSGGMVKIN